MKARPKCRKELTDTKRAAFTAEDIRFTTQGDDLYAIVLNGAASSWLSAPSGNLHRCMTVALAKSTCWNTTSH